MAVHRSASGSRAQPSSGNKQNAVLIDGSALYLALRNHFPDQKQLDYRALIEVITSRVPGLRPPSLGGGGDMWVMWTSAAPENPGQSRFLDYMERELHVTVRRFTPLDSFMVEPAALNITPQDKTASRLVRFDSSLAFAMGRLAASHRFVVVTDSFALAEPLMRAGRTPSAHAESPPGKHDAIVNALMQASEQPKNALYRATQPTATTMHRNALVNALMTPPIPPVNFLTFFGRALDARWHRVLGTGEDGVPEFIDLDERESELFGYKEKEVAASGMRDNFLL